MISFIIPAHNAEKTIEDTVRSIRRLKTPYEILAVENGSSDGTAKVLEALKGEDLTVLRSETGVSRARNTGLMQARGEWVAFADADDEILPGMAALAGMADDALDLLIGSFLKDDDPVLHDYSDLNTPFETCDRLKVWMLEKPTKRTQAWAKLYRRSFLLENGLLFDENLSFAEDAEFVIRVLQASYRVLVSDTPVYRYQSGAPSVMRGFQEGRIQKYLDAIRAADKDLAPESEEVHRAFRDFVIAHVNIMAVHDIFGTEIEASQKERKEKIRSVMAEEPVRKAVESLRLTDLKDPNNLPSYLFSHGAFLPGGWICLLRSLQNRRRYRKAVNSAAVRPE